MKKILVCGALFAAMSLPSFALGAMDGSAGQRKQLPQTQQRKVLQVSRGAEQAVVYRAGDLPYVPDVTYYPEANPRAKQAEGALYVKPSGGLRAAHEYLPPPVYAISGVKGQRLDTTLRKPKGKAANPYAEAVDIFVYIGANDYFIKDVREGYDATAWIRNLPSGLRARAHGIKVEDVVHQISFYITGTPKTAQRSAITVVIPKEYLYSGRERTFVSSTEEAGGAASHRSSVSQAAPAASSSSAARNNPRNNAASAVVETPVPAARSEREVFVDEAIAGIEAPSVQEEQAPQIAESAPQSKPAAQAKLGTQSNPYDWTSTANQLKNSNIPVGSYVRLKSGKVKKVTKDEVNWAKKEAEKAKKRR